MKKQKSSIIVLSCSESSDDETEKAKPKIDKEELRKYLQNSDDESSQNKTSHRHPFMKAAFTRKNGKENENKNKNST